ncbi:hypothetical protein GYMLUDRAFT_60349 [Collybiopsis luxurians FD-317 M1]|uniref:Uncharacterized protein n=1 Tax=Collybiopsis luxurians FD-317 M1 TaxID=944289 RepID=A0A0D0C9H1_9AGAR|nr:hypothetical protein GYMLUDRAFT_60349 [Collybiopsis luxurians FD-317 M1]
MTRCPRRIQAKASSFTDLQTQYEASGSEFKNDAEEKDQNESRPRKRAERNTGSKGSALDENFSSRSSLKQRQMPEQFQKIKGKLGLLERLAKDVPLDVILEV